MVPFYKERTRDTEVSGWLGYPEKLSCDEYCGFMSLLPESWIKKFLSIKRLV